MTELITCPSCQTQLHVPPGTEAESYTCPRCLAVIKPGPTTPTGITTASKRNGLDVDVAQDQQQVGWFRITLLVLGIFALVVFLFLLAVCAPGRGGSIGHP